MPDEKPTREYVLLYSARHNGELYQPGDVIELDQKTGDRLAANNPPSVKLKDADDPDRGEDLNPGLHNVADESSTLGTGQTVDEHGEVKATSFGHPDQVEASEDAADKAAQRGRARRTARGETEPDSGSDGASDRHAETPKPAPKAGARATADKA